MANAWPISSTMKSDVDVERMGVTYQKSRSIRASANSHFPRSTNASKPILMIQLIPLQLQLRPPRTTGCPAFIGKRLQRNNELLNRFIYTLNCRYPILKCDLFLIYSL